LVDSGSLSRGVSVVLASSSSEIPKNGCGLEDAAMRGFQSWYFTQGMFLQVFWRFPLVPRNSDKLNWKMDKSEEELHLGSSGGVVLRAI